MRRSRERKRRGFALCVVLLALALAIVLRPRTHATPMHAAPRRPQVVVEYHRKAPQWTAIQTRRLRAAVREALTPATDGARAWSCVVMTADGALLYDDRGNAAVEPASAEKIIVADAALRDFGSGYRFDTIIAAMHPPQNAVLHGNLWLAGSGDPSLRSRDLAGAIRDLQRGGLHTVQGSVVVDGSALAGDEINPLWNADDQNEDFMAATSGMSIDEDTVEFDVTGSAPGSPPVVRIVPQSSAVRYDGSIDSGSGDDVVVAATESPNQFRLSGSIPSGVTERFWVPVHGIPQYAGRVTTALLKRGGVTVARPPQTGTLPLDAQILWQHRSQPLSVLLHHMLVFSDNHYAEQIMRALGGIDSGPADDRNGIAAERDTLAAQAVPTPGLQLVDGSGLAHANRVAAVTLAGILAHFERMAAGNELYPLLPRGGKEGTLKMYRFASAAGRVRAKSGHLDDASSLAGYVQTNTHGRLIFAFMINGSPGDPDAAIVSAVDRLAGQ